MPTAKSTATPTKPARAKKRPKSTATSSNTETAVAKRPKSTATSSNPQAKAAKSTPTPTTTVRPKKQTADAQSDDTLGQSEPETIYASSQYGFMNIGYRRNILGFFQRSSSIYSRMAITIRWIYLLDLVGWFLGFEKDGMH